MASRRTELVGNLTWAWLAMFGLANLIGNLFIDMPRASTFVAFAVTFPVGAYVGWLFTYWEQRPRRPKPPRPTPPEDVLDAEDTAW